MPTDTMTADQFRKRGKEAVWQRKIINMAKLYGYRVYHTQYALGSDRGFPDLCLIHPNIPQTIFVEVKGPRGKISDDQIAWLADINTQPGRLGIVAYPDDLEAVGELLGGRPVEIYDDPKDPVLRVRLIEE